MSFNWQQTVRPARRYLLDYSLLSNGAASCPLTEQPSGRRRMGWNESYNVRRPLNSAIVKCYLGASRPIGSGFLKQGCASLETWHKRSFKVHAGSSGVKISKLPRVYVAGHNGMVGSAIVRALEKTKSVEIVTRTHKELDLVDQAAVRNFLATAGIDQVYLAAAKVGGIYANNSYPADFIYDNMMIAANVIDGAFRSGVKKLLFLGSSCIYPRLAPQPMPEEALLTGELEPTNEPYAIAKIAGIKLCESYNRQHGVDFRSVMPTNLYGPGDNYHPENSHVVPALLRRFHEAKLQKTPQVTIWGTGTPRREFLYVDDMADACVYVMSLDKLSYMQHVAPMNSHLNVGYGEDLSIAELANTIGEIVGYGGEIVFDHSKPDGAPRKLMESAKLNRLGWKPTTTLVEGIQLAYTDFMARG